MLHGYERDYVRHHLGPRISVDAEWQALSRDFNNNNNNNNNNNKLPRR
jgi:hypothetical protein